MIYYKVPVGEQGFDYPAGCILRRAYPSGNAMYCEFERVPKPGEDWEALEAEEFERGWPDVPEPPPPVVEEITAKSARLDEDGRLTLELYPEDGVGTGTVVKFKAPCGSYEVTQGIQIRDKTYTVADAVGKILTGGRYWEREAVVSILVDTEKAAAYLQNTVTPEAEQVEYTGTASGLAASNVQDAIDEVAGGVGATIIREISIPADGWTPLEAGQYRYQRDVDLEESREAFFPSVALHPDAIQTANEAGLCQTAQSLEGALRFWAEQIPEQGMQATAELSATRLVGSGGGGSYILPAATATRLGGVKIGQGIGVTADGTISSKGTVSRDQVATQEDASGLLEEVFREGGA